MKRKAFFQKKMKNKTKQKRREELGGEKRGEEHSSAAQTRTKEETEPFTHAHVL
jgi:hypothetical protein